MPYDAVMGDCPNFWYDVGVASVGALASLLVALIVLYLGRRFSQKDANTALIATLDNERRLRNEERRIEGLQELRAGLARLARHSDDVSVSKKAEALFADVVQEITDSMYLHHVYWTAQEDEVATDLNTVLDKWLRWYRKTGVSVDANNDLMTYLNQVTKFFSASIKNEHGVMPKLPAWWIETSNEGGAGS